MLAGNAGGYSEKKGSMTTRMKKKTMSSGSGIEFIRINSISSGRELRLGESEGIMIFAGSYSEEKGFERQSFVQLAGDYSEKKGADSLARFARL